MYDRFIDDYDSVTKINSINSKIIRIGECFMNNKLMNAINKSEIKIDSSALPGRKRNDREKFFDWEKTTNDFYYVSKKDYRESSNENYDILEMPLTTILMKAIYDKIPIKRYFNLSFKSDVLFKNAESYIKNNNNLVSITHPFEVLSSAKHDLISYDINVFKNNLIELTKIAEKCDKKIVIKKISNSII